jgi:hypothetical protein
MRSMRSAWGAVEERREDKSSREASSLEGVSRLGTDREQAGICRGESCGEPDHVYMSMRLEVNHLPRYAGLGCYSGLSPGRPELWN